MAYGIAVHPNAPLTPEGRRRMVACVVDDHWTVTATAERFHRILLEEWAYIRPWISDTQRTRAYEGFVHFYNHHRSHGSLTWATPISILEDNVPEEHN